MSWKYYHRVKKQEKILPEKAADILLRPVISEKSTRLAQYNQYVFYVMPKATKANIKGAVEVLFKVEVVSVHTLCQQGKVKRFRGRIGKRVMRKKAIVKLAEGSTLDIGLTP